MRILCFLFNLHSYMFLFLFYSYVGICCLASHSSSLVELDLSGCMSVTNKSLEALKENLLFARENKTHLNLLIGGNCAHVFLCE